MASRNSITGDEIRTKGILSKQGEENYDRIFSKDRVAIPKPAPDKPVECTKTDEWDEARIDTIGQNGNDGEHYFEDAYARVEHDYKEKP